MWRLRLHMQISVISVLHYRNLTKDFSICSRQQKSLNVRKERRIRNYAQALSGLGEGYFRKGELDKSIKTYEKALEEILANYGENDYYRVTVRNLELVRDTKKRAEAVRNQKMKGMDIARRYYEEYGKPMLEEKFPEYVDRVAAGLVGEGSECLGS